MTSRFFNLQEFLDSSVARQKGISNSPSWEIVRHLEELAAFLDGLRSAWGSGIKVTSGFRCEKLNKAVGGVSNSAHRFGDAADLQPVNGDFDGFCRFVKNYLKDKNFDECLIEKSKTAQWVHLALRYNNTTLQRRKIGNLVVK